MTEKKILIIARDFLPYCNTLGGVIRVLKLAEYLGSQGFDVTLLAAKGHEISYFGYEDAVRKLNVVYVEDAYQMRMTRPKSPGEAKPKKETVVDKLKSAIRSLIKEFSIPDAGVFFGGGLVSQAKNIIEQQNIKNVLVTSPPHSTQIVGLKLKKFYGGKINLITEYRDSWNTLGIFGKKTIITKLISKYLEKIVLKHCDHFIYHSPKVIKKISEKIFDASDKAIMITNGYDSSMKNDPSVKNLKNSVLTIGHFGGITDNPGSFRNPAAFFNVVANSSIPVKLDFYGPADIGIEWQEKLGGRLELHGNVSHAVALEKMGKTDVLMLVHSQREGADEVIPGKLYEYILAERPTLVVGPDNMEAANIVKEKCLGYAMDIYDPKNMEQVLLEIQKSWLSETLPKVSVDDHPEFSRNYQYAKIKDILV